MPKSIAFQTFWAGSDFNALAKQSILDACYALWYCDRGKVHTAVRSEGTFDSVFNNFKIDFKFQGPKNLVLTAGKEGGTGVFDRLLCDSEYANDDIYKAYVK